MKVFKQIGRRTISSGERAKENNRKTILVIFPPSILNDMPHIIYVCDENDFKLGGLISFSQLNMEIL